jgi:acetolactate synthase regulatory subunit
MVLQSSAYRNHHPGSADTLTSPRDEETPMLDTMRRRPTVAGSRRPTPTPAAATPVASLQVELTVTENPDALARIVRVASTTPFTLLTLWLGAPSSGRRQLRMSVAGDEAQFETLRKRFDRVVDILKVKVVR